MNYLAHILLSGEDVEIMLGNFVADGLTAKECDDLPLGLQDGVRLHRAIDRYTDRHRSFRAAVYRLRSRHGKYAPVVLDILNDHLLCCQWTEYSMRSFSEFETGVYRKFAGYRADPLPAKARMKVDILLRHKYLAAYQYRDAMTGVLDRMDQRASFESNFAQGIDHLYEELPLFSKYFSVLMDDLKSFSEKWLQNHFYPSK